MTTIITGGTGLIGRALAGRLADEGQDVVLLSRRPERVAGLPRGARVLGWDGRTAEGWGPLAEGATAIVNLAGAGLAAGRWTETRKALIRQSRVDAGRAVVAAVAAAARKPAVLVQASAVGYYGPRGDEALLEDSPAGEGFLASVCRDWEGATAEVEALGVRRVVLRTGVVLSAAGGALPKMALPVKWFVGGRVGSGRQWLSWVHMDDVTGAIAFLIGQSEAAGAYNLSGPEPLTNADFTRVLGRTLGRPTFLPVPAFAMQLLFGELSSTLLTGQRVLPRRLQEAGYSFRFPAAAAALADIYG